ncbi:MAG: hypothetical protein GY930_22325 [bacterium]|nr:hypothetical protein [bacterium]
MFQRLILLWGACLALVLSISSCGGDSEDFKPVNKTGALDGGAPDVILFVLEPSEQSALESLARAETFPAPGRIVFGAAYARTPGPVQAKSDLFWLGKTLAQEQEADNLLDSPLFTEMRKGGYSTRIVGDSQLQPYLDEESAGPRFVLVQSSAMLAWAVNMDGLAKARESSKRGILTVFTALPVDHQAEKLAEERLRVPLVFTLPNATSAPELRTQVVSLPDVGVTILDLCGLLLEGSATSDNEGASFARILQKKPLAWRGFVLAKTASGDGWIRSTRWRLLHSTVNGLTLSYIEKDPLNTRDDSDLPGAQAQLEGLGARLEAWLK